MTWFSISLLRLLHAVLPFTVLGRLGEGLGALLYYLAGWRRRVGETNLRLCFPDLDDAARTRLLKAHFRGIGRVSLQETVSWWGSRDEVMRMTRLAGLEHLTPHLGKPLILFAPHFLGVTIGGVRLTTEYAPMVTLNARIKNPRIHQLVFQGRIRFGASEVYERSAGIKPVLRAIKKGLPFYYPPDMDFGRRDAVFVPFFGVPAATITGLSRLARVTGAVVVPLVTRWEGDYYVVRCYPAWEDFPSEDVVVDTRRMNAFIEERIREMPEQYFWLHKRFKTRPDGEAGFYE